MSDKSLTGGVLQAVTAGAASAAAAGVGAGTAAGAAAAVAAGVTAGSALTILSSFVKHSSNADALPSAVRAYQRYAQVNPDLIRNPHLYFVDFGLDNKTKRGWVFDMEKLKLVAGPFAVAHGKGSGERDGIPTRFLNEPNSKATSLGLYLTLNSYEFHKYDTLGLRLKGESGGFNDAAYDRRIVVHGASYVSLERAGQSWGCPAVEVNLANRLLPKLAKGAVVFLYSPLDQAWLSGDPWLKLDS